MKRFFIIGLAFFCFIPLSAQAAGFNVTEQTCGAFHYQVTRIVDGFFVKVTDGSRVRTILYPSTFNMGGEYTETANMISGCYGDGIAFKEFVAVRYGENTVIRFVDPDQDELRIVPLSRAVLYKYSEPFYTVYTPADSQSVADSLLSRPLVNWTIDRTGLVSKQRIAPEQADALNDRSYYILDSSGKMVRKISSSNWNQTEAKTSIVCQGVAYVVYAKKFSDPMDRTVKHSEPPIQFIIERSGDGRRTLIPVPVTQGRWDEMGAYDFYLDSPKLIGCYGKHAVLTSDKYKYTTVVTDATKYINSLDYTHGVETAFDKTSAGLYYQRGFLSVDSNGQATGSSVIRILNEDGSVTDKHPVYFKNIMDFPSGSSMEFLFDSRERDRVIVGLYQPSTVDTQYFLEVDGTYQEVSRDRYEWTDFFLLSSFMTPLHLATDSNGVSVSSTFLKKPMLLQSYPGKHAQITWSRIGPLELDGTRKIWYGVTVNGKVETWLVRVR